MVLPISTLAALPSSSSATASGVKSPATSEAPPTTPQSSTFSLSSLASLAASPSTRTITSTAPPTSPSPPSAKPSTSIKPDYSRMASEAQAKLEKPIKPRIKPGAKILLVGEAPGEQEVVFGQPFVGNSGQLLREMLLSAGINMNDCSLANVFLTRPANNALASFGTCTLTEARAGVDGSKPFALIKADSKSYLPTALVQEALVRLRDEIEEAAPNVIVALGNTAMSALCGVSGIGKVRGVVFNSTLFPGVKVLPTYHPSAVFSQYDLRPICEADFIKLYRESLTSDFNYIRRLLYITPTLEDVVQWADHLCRADRLATDVETKNRQITCIGFAPSKAEAYVIPFWSKASPTLSYWKTFEEEKVAWQCVQRILSSDSIKIFQNGMYDIQYCLRHGWRVNRPFEDTMLKHHALYPNLPKGLDFLGSLYCNERNWKKMRPRGGEEKKEA